MPDFYVYFIHEDGGSDKLNYLNDNLTAKPHNLSVLSFLLLPRSDVHLSILLSRSQKDKKESKQRDREKLVLSYFPRCIAFVVLALILLHHEIESSTDHRII